MANVSITPQLQVYSTFRYLANRVHNALAEYVDNSISSFEQHRDVLSSINEGGKVRVDIEFNLAADRIVIKDNAFGIEKEKYDRAFELASPPIDANGLNEFGMGMKVSSIWLCDHWEVETSAYGENVRKKFVFDLKDVLDNQRSEVDVEITPADANEHYTIITLTKLSQNKPKQTTPVKRQLATINTVPIRNGVLDLYFNGEKQEISSQAVLNAPYYKDTNGISVEWKRNFDFKFGSYSAKGFIALLDRMSTYDVNGFLLLRRNRAIGDRFRPEVICGKPGSERYKRIFGEIEVEGFDVSYTKNAISQDDDLMSLMEMLKDHIQKEWTDFKILQQADNYRKPTTPDSIAQKMNQSLKAQVSTPVNVTTNQIPVPKPSTAPAPLQVAPSTHNSLVTQTLPVINTVQGAIQIDNYVFDLGVGCTHGDGPNGLYSLVKKTDGSYESIINLDNPFFTRFGDTFSGKDGYESIINIIRVLSAGEVVMLNDGDLSASNAREQFNKLIGKF